MIPIKEFYCESTPTPEEVKVAHVLCKQEHCVVHLNWFVQYSGWHDRFIHEDTDIDKLIDSLSHIVYGM